MINNFGAIRLLISLIVIVLARGIVYGQNTNEYANSMQMLQLVNNARIQANIRPLCLSEKLVRAATAHSTYQASINTMTHDGPVSLGDRFTQQGYQPSAVAENVGFTSTPFIQVVFDIWMSSPEHRANILDPNYVHFGAASSMGSNNMYFWTQLFAKPLNLYSETCDFAAAAAAARLNPGQNTGFSPNGAWGGGNNFNAYTPGMNPAGTCISIDNGSGGKSLSCKLNGSSTSSSTSSISSQPGYNAIPYNSPGVNSNFNPNMNSNPYNSNFNNQGYGTSQNPITSPMGPSVINNPPGYDGTSCSVVSTSPAPDGQGSVRVLRCAPNSTNQQQQQQQQGFNNLTPRTTYNSPGIQSMPDGSAIMINNPNAPVTDYNAPNNNYNSNNNPPGTGYNSITGYNPPNGTGYNNGYNNPTNPAPNAPVNGVYSPFWQ